MTRQQSSRRFWDKVDKTSSERGCWLWTSSKTKRGYGLFHLNKKARSAHRVSWTMANGEIPANMCVCHTCDSPSCVNPKHLWIGTHKDNMEDRENKNRNIVPQGSKHGMSKLKEWQIPVIRAMIKSGLWTQAGIGRVFGVGQDTISYIKCGKLWRHVA